MENDNQLYVPTAAVSHVAAANLILAANEAASKIGIQIAVAVVDPGGVLKAFNRSDFAPFLTADASINKAWTAASFGYPTHVWNEIVGDPKLAPLSQTPRFLAVGGGYPLLTDGKLVGGVGISGGTYVQDQQIAEIAIEAAGFGSS